MTKGVIVEEDDTSVALVRIVGTRADSMPFDATWMRPGDTVWLTLDDSGRSISVSAVLMPTGKVEIIINLDGLRP